MADTEQKVEETTVLKRIPPGDVWQSVSGDRRFSSLTAALDYVYNETGAFDFSVYARRGEVCTKSVVTVSVPVKKYSLYGED